MSSYFHISIAWMLHPPSQALMEKMEELSHDLQALSVGVGSVKVKIGNVVSSIDLEREVDSKNSIVEKCVSAWYHMLSEM